MRGAAWSRGGRSILAFYSTAGRGKISGMVPHIDEGASVVTNRVDVHFIVTEHGIADLRGKTVNQRAKALISIARPDFRENLEKEFHRIYGRWDTRTIMMGKIPSFPDQP